MSPPRLKLVLLGAGGSTRMRGGDKLLEPVEGAPLIRRQALAMLAAVLATFNMSCRLVVSV